MFELNKKNYQSKDMATRIENPFTLEQYIEDRGIIEFVRWFDSGILTLSPDFQRSYKWTKKQASELIESFLLGLPVPNIFLYKENNKRVVIDGVQRLTTIIKFFKNEWTNEKGIKEEFSLDFRDDKKEHLEYKWQGKTINTMADEDKLRLENFSQLRVTTIKQEDPNDNTSIYYLFERLNSGGTKLTSMEVRNSIYRGRLLDAIKEQVYNNTNFCKLVRRNKNDKSDETIYEEVLLRIFAFYDNLNIYSRDITLVKFLNDYCKSNREPNPDWLKIRIDLFQKAIKDVKFIELVNHFMSAKNNGILEALFVIYFQNSNKINYNITSEEIKNCVAKLPKSATYSKDNVNKRFNLIKSLIIIND